MSDGNQGKALADVDLHMHSTASDGTDTPARLLEKVMEAKLRCFSLTDHDTCAGVEEILPLIPEGITFFPGIEFSCRYRNRWQCHVLGYGADMDHPAMKAAVAAAHEMRFKKLTHRLRRLEEQRGISFSQQDILDLKNEPCPGKPHLADLLVKRGHADSFREAFDLYLDKIDKDTLYLEPEVMIRAVREAGGIPVWAHPFGEKTSSFTPPEEVERRIVILKELGIMGLECYYSKYSLPREEFLRRMAGRYGLWVSGGSDYHGSRKKVLIGTLGKDAPPPAMEDLTLLGELMRRSKPDQA